MSLPWTDLLLFLGIQHLWQSAVLLLLGIAIFKPHVLNANLRSWVWLGVLVFAALSPLAVLLPSDARVAAMGESHSMPSLSTHAATVVLPDVSEPSAATVADQAGNDWRLPDFKLALVLLWMLGFAWNLRCIWCGWLEARHLRSTASRAPELEWLVRQRLPAGTAICVSDEVVSPMAMGLRSACILIPTQLVKKMPEPVIRDILHHEIAHVRRQDLWFSLVQRLLTAVYWWSPFMRLITMKLNLAREMACDEHAACHTDRKNYARSLLASVDNVMLLPHGSLLANRFFSPKKFLAQRIDGLLDMDKVQKFGYKRGAALCALVLASGMTLTLVATPRMGNNHTAPQAAGQTSIAAAALVEAAKASNLDEIRRLVAAGADINSGVDGDGTALIAASKAGHLDVVDALLQLNAQPDVCWDGDGTALIAASGEGHLDIAARLLGAGAQLDLICDKDETALISASRGDRTNVTIYLVDQGAHVNLGVMADLDRWRTPLNQGRDPALRSYLIAHGATENGDNKPY